MNEVNGNIISNANDNDNIDELELENENFGNVEQSSEPLDSLGNSFSGSHSSSSSHSSLKPNKQNSKAKFKNKSKAKSKTNSISKKTSSPKTQSNQDHKFFEYTCTKLDDGIDQALAYFPIDNRTLIGYEILEEGSKKFMIFGAKEIKYKFFIKPIYKSLLLPFLIEMIKIANLSLFVKVSFKEPALRVTFSGKDQDLLTRNDNELLRSFEHLVRIYLYKRVVLHEGIKFIVRCDKNGRNTEDSLKKLANTTKAKVIEKQESVLLKPLSPSDRRIIHQFFEDDSDVQTTSLGDGRFKQIEISLR